LHPRLDQAFARSAYTLSPQNGRGEGKFFAIFSVWPDQKNARGRGSRLLGVVASRSRVAI
jgi:hypothetical protein